MIHRDPPEDRCSVLPFEALRAIAYRSALRKTRDQHRADDIASEFSHAWVEHGAARFPRILQVRMFVQDRCTDQSRRDRVRNVVSLEGESLASASVHTRSTLDVVAEQELLEHVATGLDGELSEGEHQQLMGVIDGSVSASEAARAHGVSSRTGRRQVSKVLESVRSKLVSRFDLSPQLGIGAWIAHLLSPTKWRAAAGSARGLAAMSISVLASTWLPMFALILLCGFLSFLTAWGDEERRDDDSVTASVRVASLGAIDSEADLGPLVALVPAQRAVAPTEANDLEETARGAATSTDTREDDTSIRNLEFEVRVVDGRGQPIDGLTGSVSALVDPGGFSHYQRIGDFKCEETAPGRYLIKGQRIDLPLWIRLGPSNGEWYLHFDRSAGAEDETVDVVVDVGERSFEVPLIDGEDYSSVDGESPCGSFGCVSRVGRDAWVVAVARREFAPQVTFIPVGAGEPDVKQIVSPPYSGMLSFPRAPLENASIRAFDRNQGPGAWEMLSYAVSE